MNRVFFPCMLLFLFSISLPLSSFAEGNKAVTILYTGSVKGNIDPGIPCTCDKDGSGGLARRAQAIESIRKEKQAVLLLDNGAVFDRRKGVAEFHLQTMGRMGYDALNIGTPELHFGKEFLEQTRVPFPYIASNLLYGGGRLPWMREYIIKEVGGIKIAILGVLDPDQLKNRDDLKGFEVIEPKAALNKLIPEIRAKADVVVLMCQMGEIPAMALVEAVRGIDVAVLAERNYIVKQPEKNTILLLNAERGVSLGLLTITLDEQRRLSVGERREILLDASVPANKEMLGLVEAHKREQTLKENKEKMGVLQMTPQEFMQRQRQEQTN